MKRRRTLIVSLLLVTALCLGIGYAAIGGNLIVNGQATIAKQDFKVKFTNMESGSVVKIEDTQAITATCTELDGDGEASTVTLAVQTLKNKGDSITVTFTIENQNDVDITLSTPVVKHYGTDSSRLAEADNKFAVTPTLGTTSLKAANDGDTDTTTLTVVITLNEVNTEDSPITQYFTITVPANQTTP